MRPVISREEAESLISMIPSIQAEAFLSRDIQELTAHYSKALHSHDCADLIELVMSIYAKKQYREQQNQKFGTVDENYMRKAEELLYGEFAVALGLAKDQVAPYIESRVDKIKAEKAIQP